MSDKFGVPTDVQLAQINKLAKRTLSAGDVFVFSSKSAGDMMIPNRYTKLSPELLQVMVDDAHKGVSFMYNHNWTSYEGLQGVPYGKVFGGRIETSNDEGETMAMYLDKYIARDDNVVDGMSANALIKKIETGILSDTSIGFSTNVMKCSICAENYYGNKCRHWRGNTYEMGDGTQKQCTLTAMPPSIILANNNNALFEESIVWDGAYPGAMVTQSKHGDIVETSTGNFVVVQDKEELPENTLFFGKYRNGDIVTMVKKSDHKKVYATGGFTKQPIVITKDSPEYKQSILGINEKPKGSDNSMNEKTLEILKSLGIEYVEGETKLEDLFNQLGEKWTEYFKDGEGEEGTLSDEYLGIPYKEIEATLGADFDTNNILKLAKEGQDYHKSLSDEAIAMGVRAMGNDFKSETWTNTFTTMGTGEIKDIMATWELQANAGIPTGRHTNPDPNNKLGQSLPDEAYRV